MADRKISELVALTSAVSSNDAIAIVDNSAAQTKKIDPKTLLEEAVKIIDAGSIPADKISGATVSDGSITTAKLADRAVTAAKLDDNSSGIVNVGALPNGIRVGQVGLDTTDNKFYVWTGSQWALVKAAGSVNTIQGDETGISQISVSVVGDEITLDTELANTSNPSEVLIGPVTVGGGPVTYRALTGVDLPSATSTTQGAVVINGDGLALDANRVVIDNTVTPLPPNVFGVVEHNAQGLITDSRPIIGADLPIATESEVGAVRPGEGIAVAPDGTVSIDNDVTAGTAAKVAFNGKGLITAGLLLETTDLPDIPSDKITGEIGEDQLADCAVTAPKICDYATCLMQEDNPGAGEFLGQFWYTPSTAQLRVYSRGSGPQNIWLPVGFGALQANNLRWGGTFDASTDKIGAVTAIGTSEGLTAGSAFPAPSDELSGLYLVCQVEGNNCTQNNIGGVAFDGGDWALCLDGTQGWVIIDANTGGGGGGGGGANYLNDLLDVTIGGAGGPFSTAPQLSLSDRQLLKYDSGDGMWKNTDLIDGGSF